VGVALVLDLLARLAFLGLADVGDLLAGAGPADLGGVEARSATDTSSTGLFLAAMIPLKDGYRGSTTPAVTLTTAGSEASTSL
jgi:hypothetical protein